MSNQKIMPHFFFIHYLSSPPLSIDTVGAGHTFSSLFFSMQAGPLTLVKVFFVVFVIKWVIMTPLAVGEFVIKHPTLMNLVQVHG